MTFVSFAQNAEDLMLWRALGDVANGFWIDVGAADPEQLSVTRAFHERGWTGVNIEPNAVLFERLLASRPRDVNLAVALGAEEGERAFHVFGDTGLSCFDEEIATAHRAAGYAEAIRTVPVMTLAELCRRHASGPIHFLKVDVEGAEAEVLRGADWTRDRPWIVLVEATRPLSDEQAHDDWEEDLIGSDYRFVWFDGVNRFYVAAEHHARLAPAFSSPPNALDDWTRASEFALLRRAEHAEGDLGLARVETKRNRAALVRARADAAALRAWLGEVETRLRADARAADEERGAAATLRDALDIERRRLDRLHESRTPVDRAIGRARRLAGRVARGAMREAARLSTLPGRPAPSFPPGETAALAPAEDARPEPAPDVGIDVGAPNPVGIAPREPIRVRGNHPVRIVHQYHHATATGDAVSNSLFILRARLRAHGFESHIHAARPDPAHRGDVRTIDELPNHADCVLIVHHSLGDPTAERLAALPARKILFYHNITPAPLLGFDPALADLARTGRRQLDLWRDHAVASFADSEVNAIELRRHGFEDVTVLNALLDMDRLVDGASRSAAARVSSGPVMSSGRVTVLFVGRVVPSKGQAELVDTFGAFRARLGGRGARLVLVGEDFGGGDYRALVVARAEAGGFRDDLVLTGGVDDATRDRWYADADLYVSMSAHEGFGVPLIEAMAHGVPVLARRAGAVAFTLGEGGVLVDGGADEMADAMLAVVLDEERRTLVVDAQRRRLRALASEQHGPALLATLARAGAAPAAVPAPSQTVRDELHITVAGHVNGSYSLAAVNRALTLALAAVAPDRTRLLPVEGQPDAPLFDVPEDEYVMLAALASGEAVRAAPHVVISQHYPLFVPDERSLGTVPDRALAFFFWEETLIPEATITMLNERFDAVLAPSRFVARALVDSGLRIPVRLVGHAPALAPFAALATRPERGHARPFTFLHVSSGFPRKGLDLLLEAWADAFTPDDAVRLVLKTFPNPHNTIRADLDALRTRRPALAPIVLLDGELEAEDLGTLYLGADAMVLPSRGEGFNVPAAEAMAAGLPLITSAVGGHRDFAGPDTALLIEGRIVPSASHLAEPGSLWFEPDRAGLVAALRLIAERCPETAQRAARARDSVLRALDPDRFARRLRDTVASLLEAARPEAARRIAILTTWGVRCGIAEYARQLVDGRPAGFRAALAILADRRAAPADGVHPVWDCGSAFDPDATARAIVSHDPHILMIQHQPGLMAWPALARLLADPRTSDRTVSVTLHNTRHLWMIDPAERRTVLASLATVARVIVHGADDLDRFRTEGFENVVMIPQGAPAPPPVAAAFVARDPAGRAVIGTYGFLLPQKGFFGLLDAFRLILDKRPDARLRMVTAFYDANSAPLAAALGAHADALGIAASVDWHTSFLPHDESMTLLTGCDVIVMPYEATLEASSAALRTTLSSLRPVAVTPIEIFREAADAVFVLSGGGKEAIRDGVEALLDDPGGCEALVARQLRWLQGRDWDRIARRTFSMLDGLFGAPAAVADPAASLDRATGQP